MTDKELLELAAKAAGMRVKAVYASNVVVCYPDNEDDSWIYWNPLTDDGDALRLAVKLNMQVTSDAFNGDTEILYNHLPCEPVKILHENHVDDPYSATRRAIVRAAAEIGRMK